MSYYSTIQTKHHDKKAINNNFIIINDKWSRKKSDLTLLGKGHVPLFIISNYGSLGG